MPYLRFLLNTPAITNKEKAIRTRDAATLNESLKTATPHILVTDEDAFTEKDVIREITKTRIINVKLFALIVPVFFISLPPHSATIS